MAPDEVAHGMVPQDGISEVNQWRGNGIYPHGHHDPEDGVNQENFKHVGNLGTSLIIFPSCNHMVSLQMSQGTTRSHAMNLEILIRIKATSRVSRKRTMMERSMKYKPLWQGDGRKERMHGKPKEKKRRQPQRKLHP